MPKPFLRLYTFSDAELKQRADATALSMQRDAADFAARGITAAMTTDLETASTNFGDMDSDEMWIGNVMEATQTKDGLVNNLKTQIRNIRNMVDVKWGSKSAKYRKYGFDDMNQLSDDKLVRLGRRTKTVVTLQQADLASEGFTNATLVALGTTLNDLDVALDVKNGAERDRDVAQQDRVEAGNILYTLLEKYSSVGKAIWAGNPAKFNDYVIYPSGTVKPPAPTPPNP